MREGAPASAASLHLGRYKGEEGSESRTRGKHSGLLRQGDVAAVAAAAVSLQLQPPITCSYMHSFLYSMKKMLFSSSGTDLSPLWKWMCAPLQCICLSIPAVTRCP